MVVYYNHVVVSRNYVDRVLRSEMVDKSTSHLQTSFGPVFYPETVQTGLLLPE